MSPLMMSLHIDKLSPTPVEFNLEATEGERKKIAKRLGLLFLESLEARLFLHKKDHLYVQGKITAHVIQQCVRTLVPVPQDVVIDVEEKISLSPRKDEQDIDLTEEDFSEYLEGGELDLGELVIQLLSLNLDPYLVAPGSTPLEYKEEDSMASPFTILKKKK